MGCLKFIWWIAWCGLRWLGGLISVLGCIAIVICSIIVYFDKSSNYNNIIPSILLFIGGICILALSSFLHNKYDDRYPYISTYSLGLTKEQKEEQLRRHNRDDDERRWAIKKGWIKK